MGRIRSFVTVCDFSALATCYAELNARLRPEADISNLLWETKTVLLPRLSNVNLPSLYTVSRQAEVVVICGHSNDIDP